MENVIANTIDYPAIEAELRRRIDNFRCVVCANNKFMIFEAPDQHLRTNIHLFKGADPVAKKHVELLTIVCSDCGHVEQFVQKVLADAIGAERSTATVDTK